jgi:hypothetical protein
MENEHVLGGLTRKRGELAGQIEHTQALLRKLVTELDTIDAAIRLFDPKADLGSIKQRLYPPRHQAFRGEMMRHVMGALRIATEPVTSLDITLAVMKGRGLNPDDLEFVRTIRKRVAACMWRLKKNGAVREVPGAGDLKGWMRADVP